MTELTNQSGITYYIKLEGAKYWLSLVVTSDGDITVEDKYRKAE